MALGCRDAKTTSAFSLTTDRSRRRLDWRAFCVLDTNKNERGISISSGARTQATLSAITRLRGVHLRRCNHCDSFRGAVPLSRDNGQPQPPKAPARAVSDLDCGCSFPCGGIFPPTTAAFAFGRIPDLVVAVAFCFVAIDARAAVRAGSYRAALRDPSLTSVKNYDPALLTSVRPSVTPRQSHCRAVGFIPD